MNVGPSQMVKLHSIVECSCHYYPGPAPEREKTLSLAVGQSGLSEGLRGKWLEPRISSPAAKRQNTDKGSCKGPVIGKKKKKN